MFKLLILIGVFSQLPVAGDHIQEKLIAVHATDQLPEEGVLRAGLGDPITMDEKWRETLEPLYRSVRPTLHFSLGELVRPIPGKESWEEKKFAILTPLKDLLPQAVNLNCYDTFILGDFHLTDRSLLLVPLGTEVKSSCYQICIYDPETSSLRAAVARHIEQMGGWNIEMMEGDVEHILAEAKLQQKNINTKSFFAPLLKGRPHVSVGLRFDPHEGKHYLLAEIEKGLREVVHHFFPCFSTEDPKQPRKQLSQIREQFAAWKAEVKEWGGNERVQGAIQRVNTTLHTLTQLSQLEQHLQELQLQTLKQVDRFCLDNVEGLEAL